MGAIKDAFGKEEPEVGLADIQNLIDQKVEENKTLEYKDPDILANPKRLSEWVSAFLNAEGGLIIIGVCEDKPNKKDNLQARIYPTKIAFVDSKYTRERVEQMIFSNIYCSARPEIRIFPIRDPNDSSKTMLLVEIPRGDNPPYQAADNRYYRRLNVTKYPLAHYEIADFFGRRRRPHLNL
jgi:predicted HTH transcriptional regulator